MSYTPKTHRIDPDEVPMAARVVVDQIIRRAGGGLAALRPIGYTPATGRLEFWAFEPGSVEASEAAVTIRDRSDRRWLASLIEVLDGPKPTVIRGQEGEQ